MASLHLTPENLIEAASIAEECAKSFRHYANEMQRHLPQGLNFPQAPDISGAIRAFMELSAFLRTELLMEVLANQFPRSWKDQRRQKGPASKPTDITIPDPAEIDERTKRRKKPKGE